MLGESTYRERVYGEASDSEIVDDYLMHAPSYVASPSLLLYMMRREQFARDIGAIDDGIYYRERHALYRRLVRLLPS